MADPSSEPEPTPSEPESARGDAGRDPRPLLDAAIGIGIAVVIFIVMDGLFWFLLRALGILPSGSAITGWTPTMYGVWVVVAVFAGAGYALASVRPDSAAGWAWRAAGGTAIAVVLYLVLDTQLWAYLNAALPSNSPISGWPTPIYQLWIAMSVLVGIRFLLARSKPFSALWWACRAVGGVALGLGTYFAAVWLPVYLVSSAQSDGVPLPSFPAALAAVGALLALLVGAAYAAHPTRYFGPLEIGAGALEIVYFVFIVGTAPYAIEVRSIALSIGTWAIVLGLIVVILISMAGDAVTTFQDFAHPGERRDWEYPTTSEPGAPSR